VLGGIGGIPGTDVGVGGIVAADVDDVGYLRLNVDEFGPLVGPGMGGTAFVGGTGPRG